MGGEVPESEVDDLVVDFKGGGFVVEDGGLVLAGEGVFDVAGWGEHYL